MNLSGYRQPQLPLAESIVFEAGRPIDAEFRKCLHLHHPMPTAAGTPTGRLYLFWKNPQSFWRLLPCHLVLDNS